MISTRIINSARFLQLPLEAQLLYFHMIVRADDDGIVESYPIMKLLGTTPDNYKLLIIKGFIREINADQVIIIENWQEHNKIRADRKVDSIYKQELLEKYPDIKLIEAKPRSDVKDNSARISQNIKLIDGGQSTDSPRTVHGRHKISKDNIIKENIIREKNIISPIKENNNIEQQSPLDDNGLAMAKQPLSNSLATEKTTKINTIPPYLVSKDFFNNKSSPYRIKAKEFLVSRGLDEQTADNELDKFISYWTELTKSGNKQRWELEKTFEVKRRLATWLDHFLKYNNNKVLGNNNNKGNSNNDNYRRLLHDGSYAINRFGVWVSEKDPNIKIDLHYYPELK